MWATVLGHRFAALESEQPECLGVSFCGTCLAHAYARNSLNPLQAQPDWADESRFERILSRPQRTHWSFRQGREAREPTGS